MESTLLTNNLENLELQEALDEGWTIQVIYPEEQSVASLLTEDTLISLENIEQPPNEEENTSKIKDKKLKKPVKVQYSECWTTNGFVCPKCGKVYNARKNLARHINIECGKPPKFSCMYCDYKNYRRNEIKKHVSKKHLNKFM